MNENNQVKRTLTADELQRVYAMTNESEYNDASVNARRDPTTRRIVSSFDGADDQLNVAFTTESVFSKVETVLNNSPTYIDQEFVTISVPGSNNVTHQPVSEYYKWRFPLEYENFRRGLGARIAGTPLSVWSHLSPSQMKHMELQGIHTVEQIANLSDNAGPAFAGFYALKAKAQQFLDAARDSTKASQLQDELAKRDAELDLLKDQMSRLMGMLDAQATEKKSKSASKGADQ